MVRIRSDARAIATHGTQGVKTGVRVCCSFSVAAHQERHQVLRRLRVPPGETLLLQMRRQEVRHHVRRDVLLLLLLLLQMLLPHRKVRCPQLTPRAVLRSEAWPGAAHPAATEVALCEAQQLCLVRRPEVEVVRAQPAHRVHRQWILRTRRATYTRVPVKSETALRKGVVYLLCGGGAVQAAAGDSDARAKVLRRIVGRTSTKVR